MADEIVLSADLSRYEAVDIPSNLAQLKELCAAKAEEYREITEIGPRYTYKEAKADRAAINRAVKQVEDERRRVKRIYSEPLKRFEDGVKDALAPLAEVQAKQAALVKDYEERGRQAKRERLEAYWEQTYPALALCTGDASEPLVPFSRVFDPEWVKKVSELDEGMDVKCTRLMDELADTLARGASTIASLSEPDDVRADALSRYYRTFDLVEAIDGAKEEARRKADMARLAEAQRETRVPAIEPEPAPVHEQEPAPVHEPDPSAPIGYAIVPIYDKAGLDHVIAVMRREGISGFYKPARLVHLDEQESRIHG